MTGDQADFLGRIKSLLPPWFGNDETPVLDGVASQPAAVFALVYQLIQTLKPELRISTATGGFVDLISNDFFGAALPRGAGETDASFIARIKAALFPKRNTRAAVIAAVEALGCTVQSIEPWNPGESNALGVNLYYSTSGYLGSRTLPAQSFLIVTIPDGVSVTNAQIYAAIEAVRMAGTIIWTSIV